MTAFPLKIVTPDGLAYEGQAEELIVRTTGGNSESIRPDGTLLVEIHGIMGSHNLQGNTLLSATTV